MTSLRRYSPDGGPIPNNVRASQRMNANDDQKSQFQLVRGYVQRAVYPEDDDNLTGDLEYQVNIGGQLYSGVLDMTAAGSIFNNHVRVRRGVGRDSLSSDGLAQNTFEDKKDGEAVWCLFVGGDGDVPIIVRSAVHPRVQENANYQVPSSDTGEFERYEQNGFEFLITNDGILTVKLVGLADPTSGQVTNTSAVDSVLTVDAAGNFSFVGSTGTTLKLDNANDALFLTCNNTDSLEVSKANGFQTSTPAGGGATISQKSGQIDVNTGKGFTVTAAGADITLVSNGGAVKLKDMAGGELNLASGKVALGNGANEVLDQLVQLHTQLEGQCDDLSNLSTAMQAETHLGNLGYPTGTPINLAQYATFQTQILAVKAQITAIKTIINTLKGSL